VKAFKTFLLVAAVAVVGFALYRAYEAHDQVIVDPRVPADIILIHAQVEMYKRFCGDYPTTAQGLSALVIRPSDAPPGWRQLRPEVPTDPFGTPYVYRYPRGNDPNGFEVFSLGPDRVESKDDLRWQE
jgi:general secretion pathway protein G